MKTNYRVFFLFSILLTLSNTPTYAQITFTLNAVTPNALQKLQVSSNARFLVKEDGTPFFWLNDTAWALPKLSNADIDLYLNDRAAKGFNSTLICLKYQSDILFNGEGPFLNNNTDTPNEAFFQHIDYVVSQAANRGLYVAITMMWAEDYQALIGTDAQKSISNGQVDWNTLSKSK